MVQNNTAILDSISAWVQAKEQARARGEAVATATTDGKSPADIENETGKPGNTAKPGGSIADTNLPHLQNKTDHTMNGIWGKIFRGQRLNDKERVYLKNKDPDQYDRVRRYEWEQCQYKKLLRSCRTKTERRDVSFNKTMSIISAAGKGANSKDPIAARESMARLNYIREAERQGRLNLWA